MKRILFTALVAAAMLFPVASASAQQRLGTAEVQAIQQALRDAGYYRQAPVDGLWGRYSRQALANFQSDKGLKVTGYPDKQTAALLGVSVPDSKQKISENSKRQLNR